MASDKYRCRMCGCLWRLNPPSDVQPEGSWSLFDGQQRPRQCCDNAPMVIGGNIEAVFEGRRPTVWEHLLEDEAPPVKRREPLIVKVPTVLSRLLEQQRREERRATSPLYCEHANESPHRCPCERGCYCQVQGNCRVHS